MNVRSAAALLALVISPALGAGWIQYDGLQTFDTGARLLNGRWKIGATVEMSYFNAFGAPASADWRAQIWINSVGGALLVGTGWENFTAPRYVRTVDAWADYSTCYQGKSVAIAGGDTKQVGGNHVCTDAAPPAPPPGPCSTCVPVVCDHCDDGSIVNEPLILDLNGDGIHTTGTEAPVLFDLDGDGRAELLTWTNPTTEEGFLALDLDPNHAIDGGRELFGIGTVLPSGAKASNGFEALAVYDDPAQGGNADGLVTHADAIWGRLRLWVDRNHDGRSQAAELRPIARAGVIELRLAYTLNYTPDAAGNIRLFRGTFVRRMTRDGRVHEATNALDGLVFRRLD